MAAGGRMVRGVWGVGPWGDGPAAVAGLRFWGWRSVLPTHASRPVTGIRPLGRAGLHFWIQLVSAPAATAATRPAIRAGYSETEVGSPAFRVAILERWPLSRHRPIG